PKVAAFQVKLMRLEIFSWAGGKHMFRRAAQLRLQRLGDRFRNLALNRKDISQFSIEGFSPKMRVSEGVDKLHIHANLIIRFLHASFEDVRDAELLRDLGKIVRCAFEVLRRGA